MVRHSYSFLTRWSTPTLSLCQIPQPSCSFWVSWRTCVRTSYLLPQNAPILTLNACTIYSHYWIRIRLHRNALQVESVQNWPCHLSELPSFRPSMLYLARLISKGFNILCMTIFWINCREQLLCALHNDADFCNQSQTHYKGEYLPLSMQMPS